MKYLTPALCKKHNFWSLSRLPEVEKFKAEFAKDEIYERDPFDDKWITHKATVLRLCFMYKGFINVTVTLEEPPVAFADSSRITIHVLLRILSDNPKEKIWTTLSTHIGSNTNPTIVGLHLLTHIDRVVKELTLT